MRKTVLLSAVIAISVQQTKAGNIEFSDTNVKSICISQWDINGDGELSEEEAGAVTTLGAVFQGRKNITTFHELRFFTGLTAIDDEAFKQSSINGITFPANVTSIGKRAFAETALGSEVVIPGTIKIIRAFAFSKCNAMRKVIIEEGVEEIYTEAFTGEIHFMTLPSTITYFAPEAVIPYTTYGLETRSYVFQLQTCSVTPVSVEPAAFRQLFGEGVLIVPYGCVESYRSATNWSGFYKILEAGDVNGDGALNVKDVVSLNAYIMGNNPSPFDERLADLNGDGKINVKDVTLMCSWIMQQKQ